MSTRTTSKPSRRERDQMAGYQVWVDKSRTPVQTYERLGLPCYREMGP